MKFEPPLARPTFTGIDRFAHKGDELPSETVVTPNNVTFAYSIVMLFTFAADAPNHICNINVTVTSVAFEPNCDCENDTASQNGNNNEEPWGNEPNALATPNCSCEYKDNGTNEDALIDDGGTLQYEGGDGW